MIKTCKKCGKEFDARNGNMKYCNDCADLRKRDNDRKQHREKYNHEHHIGEKRICVVCGKTFISKSEHKETCSKKCGTILSNYRKGYIRELHPITKKCVVCGKVFTTYRTRQITCSKECSEKRHRSFKRCHSTIDKIEYIKNNPPQGFELVDYEIKSTTGNVILKCKKCGETVKLGINKDFDNIECKNCIKLRKKEENDRRLKYKTRREQRQKAIINCYSELHPGMSPTYYAIHTCKTCGKQFISRHPKCLYCSDACRNKAYRKRTDRHHKQRFSEEKYIDKDITVKKVVEMNMGICQICGKPIDYNDYTIKDGAFIAGPNYPSVDHIIPRAKGGTHSWDNVQLAHFRCNTIKRDHISGYNRPDFHGLEI